MKKGFFFSMDGFFAIVLFSLVVVLIYLFFISFTSLQQQYVFADDLLTLIYRTKFSELDLSEYPNIRNLNVNQDSTIIEQIVIYQNEGNTNAINTILNDLTSGLKGNYKFSFELGTSSYGDQPTNVQNLISRNRIAIIKRTV